MAEGKDKTRRTLLAGAAAGLGVLATGTKAEANAAPRDETIGVRVHIPFRAGEADKTVLFEIGNPQNIAGQPVGSLAENSGIGQNPSALFVTFREENPPRLSITVQLAGQATRDGNISVNVMLRGATSFTPIR